MKTYVFRILLFLLFGVIIGEFAARVFHLTVDVPKAYRDSDELIKYYPNQTGYSSERYKWLINKYGNFGYEPPSLESLVSVIGNSYISNTMNPPECHQANYLAAMNDNYNFYPMSRDGACFLEDMEMAKSLEKLNPVRHLLYVNDYDFITSVIECSNQPLTVQLSVEQNRIRSAQLKGSALKEALYHFKFAYFLYRNYVVPVIVDLEMARGRTQASLSDIQESDYPYMQSLMDYVKENYRIDNVVLVFFPDSDPKLIEMTERAGFTALRLETNDYNSWLGTLGGHWSCSGHEEVARQVNKYLESLSL
jgi:hypothetical protein